jgi:hypothetical protein
MLGSIRDRRASRSDTHVYVFIIATMLVGYVLLAILGLLHVAKDLLARPVSPVPSYSESEKIQNENLPGAIQIEREPS